MCILHEVPQRPSSTGIVMDSGYHLLVVLPVIHRCSGNKEQCLTVVSYKLVDFYVVDIYC